MTKSPKTLEALLDAIKVARAVDEPDIVARLEAIARKLAEAEDREPEPA